MNDLISRQAAKLAIIEKGQASKRYKIGEFWELNRNEIWDALDGVPSARRWIPVSERLPELNDDGASDPVLLCWADRQIVVGYYAGNETFYAQSFPFATDGTARIIAWMPLPDPYKEEKL